MAGSRPRLLFLAPRYPEPPTRGDQRRVRHLLAGLSEHAEVTFVSFGAGPDLGLPGVRTRGVRRGRRGVAVANATTRSATLPLQTRLFLSTEMRRVVAEELTREPTVVHLTLARMGPYLPPAGGWHRHVDLIDALSLNMATRAAASRGPAGWPFALEARLMAAYEAGLVREAESASVVSEQDREAGPGLESASVIPNGVDADAFPYREPDARAPTVLFFGNLGYFHNVEPARFVAREVLPRLRERVPGVQLRLAGARPAPAVRALAELPGVSFVGPVDRMPDELHRAAVALVPMFSGSGIKNKVLESFSAGTPVVTNALGIAGVRGAHADEHYLGGESADELAQATARLLGDPALRISLARPARELIGREYSWERQVRALLDLYGDRL